MALGSWDASLINNYSLVATKRMETTGTYVLLINGTEMICVVANHPPLASPIVYVIRSSALRGSFFYQAVLALLKVFSTIRFF